MSARAATASLFDTGLGDPELRSHRKPPSVASNSVENNRRLVFNKKGRLKATVKSRQLIENKTSISPLLISAPVREKVEAQLFRLMGKREDAEIPRIIHDRTGIPLRVVRRIIHGLIREYRVWSHEIRSSIARADEAAEQCWRKRSA